MARALGWVILIGGLLSVVYEFVKGPAKPAAPASAPATTGGGITQALEAAKSTADTIRNEVGTDPLAASLLGINTSLLSPLASPGNAGTVSDTQSKITALQNQLANDQLQYKINHDGGLSPDQEAQAENNITSQINQLSQSLTSLGS